MEREEIKKLFKVMGSAYPNFKPNDLTSTIDVWEACLRDKTYQEMEQALFAYIRTDVGGFAPSIGQLMSKLSMVQNTELSEMEAWNMVSMAIRNGNYGADEEFKKLPEVVQRCVGSPSMIRNWANTDLVTVETVIQSNFLRSFRAISKKQEQVQMLPPEMRIGVKEQVLIEGGIDVNT